MAGFVQDGYIHSIARFLIQAETIIQERYNGTLNHREELEHLNSKFLFVSNEFFGAFYHDVMNAYRFHKERHSFSISNMAMLNFKYHSSPDPLRVLREDLADELGLAR